MTNELVVVVVAAVVAVVVVARLFLQIQIGVKKLLRWWQKVLVCLLVGYGAVQNPLVASGTIATRSAQKARQQTSYCLEIQVFTHLLLECWMYTFVDILYERKLYIACFNEHFTDRLILLAGHTGARERIFH